MPSVHKSTVYKPGNAPNPFQKGQDRAYGDILLDKMQEMKWWRGIIGIGILAISFINFIFFVYALKTQKTVPVLINVMPTGEAVNLGEVRQTGNLQVPEAAILFQAKKFITNIRSISTDADVLYQNIDDCYFMATSNYEPIMTRMLHNPNPFTLIGKIRRTLEIESALHITESSYQIDWIETTYENNAQMRKKMRAIITIKLITPDSNVIKRNPLGIFIDNCEMTEL